MNRLIERKITSIELRKHLLDNETNPVKAEKIVNDILEISSTIYVGENGKFVSVRAKGFIGISSCNRYTRHNGKRNNKPDEFDFSRGVSIASSRLSKTANEEV